MDKKCRQRRNCVHTIVVSAAVLACMAAHGGDEQLVLARRGVAGEALKLYLPGHLLWNPRQPLEPLLSRFYRRYYGAAGKWMRRYMSEMDPVLDEARQKLAQYAEVRFPPM